MLYHHAYLRHAILILYYQRYPPAVPTEHKTPASGLLSCHAGISFPGGDKYSVKEASGKLRFRTKSLHYQRFLLFSAQFQHGRAVETNILITFPKVTPSFTNNVDLLSQCALGDEKAFKKIYEMYHFRLHQYILNIVKSKQVAEELVMDVFLKLWVARDMLPGIENFDGFLFKIAYNKSIDFFRAAAKDKLFADILWEKIQIPAQNTADTPLLTREFDEKLREAIALMPPQRQKVFKLSREENLSHTQISEALGISKSTVANTIVEARQFITNYLGRHFDVLTLITILSGLIQKK